MSQMLLSPPKTSVVLLGSGKNNLNSVQRLIIETGLADSVMIRQGQLATDAPIAAEIAIAVFSAGHAIAEYSATLASLKKDHRIPVVLAMIPKDYRDGITSNSFGLAADQVLFYPLPANEFGKIMMSHVSSLRISKAHAGDRDSAAKNVRPIGQLLIEAGIVTTAQIEKALEYQKGSDTRIGDALVMFGFLTEEQKIQHLAMQLGIQTASARQYASVDLATIALIPEHVARRHNCVALEKRDHVLTVAMDDVLNLQLLDLLRDICDLAIKPVLGLTEDIQATVDRSYRDLASQKDASILIADLGEGVEYVQQDPDDISIEEAAAAGAELGIIKLVNMLIANAIRDRASDIHIEPMEQTLSIRYRIDGELHKVMSPPKPSHPAIITRIKILSDLDIAERRLPQDGRMVVKMKAREVDIRVSILPTVFGEKAVLRILDKEAFEKSVSNLGFAQPDLEQFRSQVAKPYGMIIVTGPTGSGKSTTLYGAIQTIKSVARNIVTVEDPVEFHMETVNQVHVNTKIGLTFGAALRSILRQDPDVILIGEIRDTETADIAIKMALTGHLVFSTLHTNDAASSIARFVDIGIPPLLLASSLNLIIAQRLVRRICPRCKVAYTPSPEILAQLNLQNRKDATFYRGEGCVNCNGIGYSGRTGVFEMLAVSKDIRTLILRNASTMEIQAQAEREGMRTLRQAGIALALQGATTIEQVIAVTTEI